MRSGHEIIAVNNSWELVPGCSHIFAADLTWWMKYHNWIGIGANRWTQSKTAHHRYGLKLFNPDTDGTFNSGQRAIQLAVHLGAGRVLLLGYDASLENVTHWHGEHPDGMHNPDVKEVTQWKKDFSLLNKILPGVEIINCSRHTALTCFERKNLEAALIG